MDNPTVQIPFIETRIEVLNQVEDTAELYIYGTIAKSSWWDESTVSSKSVKEKLETIEAKTIKVHINSGGGDVFESIAIHNLLKQHDATIEMYVDGLAGSGASIILMAGDKRYMPVNAMVMVHKASTYGYGNSDDFRKVADDLDKIDAAVIASYKSRFIGTTDELTELVTASTWLTAEESLALGFCTDVLDEVEEPDEPIDNQVNIKDRILNKYSNKVSGKKNPEPKTNQINHKAIYNAFVTGFME